MIEILNKTTDYAVKLESGELILTGNARFNKLDSLESFNGSVMKGEELVASYNYYIDTENKVNKNTYGVSPEHLDIVEDMIDEAVSQIKTKVTNDVK